MSQPVVQVVEEFARAAIVSVFRAMLDTQLAEEPPSPLPPDPAGQIISSVGFAGAVNGVVHLHSNVSLARGVARRMLSLSELELQDDSMVNDAFGELANMVVGNVKSKLCDHGRTCQLTVPLVLRGQQLSVERVSHTDRCVLGFRCGPDLLLAELLVKSG